MTFEEFKNKFIEWTVNKIENGVCPFAKKARLTDKIQFLDWRYSQEQQFDQTYDIAVAWTGSMPVYKDHTEDLYFFTSTKDSGFFAKNFTNVIFIQKKKDINEKRNFLRKTDYYNNWPDWYYKEITGEERT